VLECARPRKKAAQASLAPAHGGVALATSAGVRLAAVNTGGRKTTLEHVCARVTSHDSSCVILLVTGREDAQWRPVFSQSCLTCWTD